MLVTLSTPLLSSLYHLLRPSFTLSLRPSRLNGSRTTSLVPAPTRPLEPMLQLLSSRGVSVASDGVQLTGHGQQPQWSQGWI